MNLFFKNLGTKELDTGAAHVVHIWSLISVSAVRLQMATVPITDSYQNFIFQGEDHEASLCHMFGEQLPEHARSNKRNVDTT